MTDILREKSADILINFDLQNELKYIKGNETQLHQLILNLVTNAIEAIKTNESGKIKISTKNLTPDAQELYQVNTDEDIEYIALTIEDNGQGINKEEINKIFDPYFSTKKTGQNLGLGLSIVLGIIKQMDGIITVDSSVEFNKGTKFDIFFPAISDFEIKNDREPISNQTDSDKIDGTGKVVLIAEDNENLLQLEHDIFTKFNFKVVNCSDGASAYKIISEKDESIDLLITDVIMPTMNGGELIAEIRKINSKLKIIVISGYTRDIIKSELLDENTKFIPKPFAVSEMLTMAKNLLIEQ
jgi:CheY-like chemotaxis protein/anti-sigma regulatory factor (Ser/Thr protein kinase)